MAADPPPPRQARLVLHPVPPSSSAGPAPSEAPPLRARPPPVAPHGQRTLHSLARVVKLRRGAPPAGVLREALPALTVEAAEAAPDAALAALARVSCVTVSRADLAGTGVGKAVRLLKRCRHYGVSTAAAKLVDKWKAAVSIEVATERKNGGRPGMGEQG